MKSDTSKQDFESIMQEGRARAESGKVEIHIEDVLAPVKPPPIDRMARFKRHPWVYIIPICVLGLILGLGIWGVKQASAANAEQQQRDAALLGGEVAIQLELQIRETISPAITMKLMIQKQPLWSFWDQNFGTITDELMQNVVNGSLYNIQLQPFAQVRMINPLRPSDRTQPGRDLLFDPARRDVVIGLLTTKQQALSIVYLTPQNFTAAFIRQPVFISGTSSNETFGYYYPGANYTIAGGYPENRSYPPIPNPYPGSGTGFPLGYTLNCTSGGVNLCYTPANATSSSSQFWGMVTLTVNFQAVIDGKDNRLQKLTDNGYKYLLTRPLSSSTGADIINSGSATIVEVGGSVDVKKAVACLVRLPSQTWVLFVEQMDGSWYPAWEGPVIAAVVILAVIVSLLLFLSLFFYSRQKDQLQSTILANSDLKIVTKNLEDERQRLDDLVVRQYQVLALLDTKALRGNDAIASTGLTIERIEEAKKKVAEMSKGDKGGDVIEIYECLGEGAFGKVHRGIWRGTEVAIKSMILPGNMPGQEKRERMAVMEAAISSSLQHPNIVSTFTYSIREYETHQDHRKSIEDFIQLGPAGSTIANPNSIMESSGVGSVISRKDSVSSSTVHSYEVRLILEFCDKGSLVEALEQGAFVGENGLCLSAIYETAADIAKAMVHTHSLGVLHSDLKARNIMLKSSGAEGRGFIAKVADFGLSTQIEHTQTHASNLFQGTLTHMAPEVLLMSRQSKASDVYSFGILLWELFTAGQPFQDIKLALMGHEIAVMGKRPPFPTFAPQGYVKLTEKCWAAQPGDRPTFTEVLEELKALCASVGSTSRPLNVKPPQPIVNKKESGWSKVPSSWEAKSPNPSSPFANQLQSIVEATAGSSKNLGLLQTPADSVASSTYIKLS